MKSRYFIITEYYTESFDKKRAVFYIRLNKERVKYLFSLLKKKGVSYKRTSSRMRQK